MRVPTRTEIASCRIGTLRHGRSRKADLLLVDVGEGPVVVKDFSGKGLWGRTVGRIQIAREARAYRFLGRIEGVPRYLGRVDALALALAEVDGRQLAFARDLHREGATLVAKLRSLIDRLHERGLVHLDLRGRENVLVREDGELVVVDLAGAVGLRPGGAAHRLLFPLLRRADESAFLKWKLLLDPERLTGDERAFLLRFGRIRSLWVFNRKQADGSEERAG
jgi:hypothetical protein